jgi:hypothetical protein
MVWKLETSGNENGNLTFSEAQKSVFVGKFKWARKLAEALLKETSKCFSGG